MVIIVTVIKGDAPSEGDEEFDADAQSDEEQLRYD